MVSLGQRVMVQKETWGLRADAAAPPARDARGGTCSGEDATPGVRAAAAVVAAAALVHVPGLALRRHRR